MRLIKYAIISILLLSIGCEDATNSIPVINEIIYSPSTPKAGAFSATITLNAVATDGDGDDLTYNWSSSSGSFDESGIGNPINWYVGEVGEYAIKCIVSDGKETAELSVMITVLQEVGSVSGVVTDYYDGHSLEGANISMNGVSAYSNVGGAYTLENVPAALSSSITATLEGYADYTRTQTMWAGSYVHNIKMEVARGNIIGYVYNSSTNQPLSSVQVMIEDKSDYSGANGYYSMSYIEVGDRIITAIESGYITKSDTITVVEGDNHYDIYLTQE